ncbi:MAG: U32 family peptidase, partial [Clostridia bacterium]|nr:U32 family peptidase [Clostridia bacterium]
MRKDVELLAPAGCEENFYGAVNFGADAVYLGLSDFSARKNAGNFTLDRLNFILSYAHLFGVKVYLAVNTVIKNDELKNYFELIKSAYLAGVDAFIVQDLFLGRTLKSLFPNITLHLSTQAGINNVDGA